MFALDSQPLDGRVGPDSFLQAPSSMNTSLIGAFWTTDESSMRARPTKQQATPSRPMLRSKPSSPEVAAFINKRKMSPRQEVANALSMLCPIGYGLIASRMGWFALTWNVRALLWASLLHLPLSLWYHIRAALSGAGIWPLPCAIDNAERRMDQSGLHAVSGRTAPFQPTSTCFSAAPFLSIVKQNSSRKMARSLSPRMCMCMCPQVSIVFAYALSGGSVACLVCSCLFNGLAIEKQWRPDVIPARNQRNLTIAGFMHTAPLVWRQDWRNLSMAISFIVPSAFCFIRYPFGGYSHALFHVLSTGVFHAFLLSASQA